MRTGPPLASSSRPLSPGSQNSTPAPRLDRLGADPSPQPPTLFTDASEILGSCCRTWLRGAAITEIDSIPLRGGRCLIAEPVSSGSAAVLLTSSDGNQVGLNVGIMRECGNRTGLSRGTYLARLKSTQPRRKPTGRSNPCLVAVTFSPAVSRGSRHDASWTDDTTKGGGSSRPALSSDQRARRDPAGVDAARQHLTDILPNLLIEERVQLGIHRFEEVAVLLPIQRQVIELERVGLEIEQLDVVHLDERLDRARPVVLLG